MSLAKCSAAARILSSAASSSRSAEGVLIPCVLPHAPALPLTTNPLRQTPNTASCSLVGGKNVPDGKNVPWARYSENNSATRATIHKRIGARESPRQELSHTPIRV